MTRDPKYAILFQPVVIGPKVMKNRFYQTPHATGMGDCPGRQAHYRAMRAEGGWAVVNTGCCLIHPENDMAPYVQDTLWDETDVRNLALLCEKVHDHGALAGVELHFGGTNSTTYETRMATRSVCQINHNNFFMKSAYQMDRAQIRELQSFYVEAAKRARSAGFDIVNIHGREACSLPVMFLMNYYNKRGDEYGGSLQNRARFWLETIEQVREAVGKDCAIAVGLSVDSGQPEQREQYMKVEEEGIGFVELADHLVDVWDLQVGGRRSGEWHDDATPSRFFEEYWQRPWYERIRGYTKKPIVGVGRFTNPETMVNAVASGVLDIIGAARPSIADPFLPTKIEEGRLDEIRECIGCNVCVSRFKEAVAIVCTQNPTAGEEYRRGWHPETFDRAKNATSDVLVVGAGPAGMECAMVLARRGIRRVHLVDAEREMGGHMRWVPELPGLGEWARVVNYRKTQISKLRNVAVVANTRLDAQSVREYGADLVVLATGARWAVDGLNGETQSRIPGADASRPNMLTPDQIMADGKAVEGERVVIYDCDGYFMGASLAEKLAREGKHVTLLTPREKVAPYLSSTGEALRMHRVLHDLGVKLLPQHIVTQIVEGTVHGFWILREDELLDWRADSIVLVTQRVSDDSLYRELKSARDSLEKEGITGVFPIGDCVEPRVTAESIFDGHRLAREIDTSDPKRPLPYIRERRVLGFRDEDYDGLLPSRGFPAASLVVTRG